MVDIIEKDESGMLIINEELRMHPVTYHLMIPVEQDLIRDFTRSLMERRRLANDNEFFKTFEPLSDKKIEWIRKRHRLIFETEVVERKKYISGAFDVPAIDQIKIDHEHHQHAIFENSQPYEIEWLAQILKRDAYYETNYPEIAKTSTKFAKAQWQCNDATLDFIAYFEFACKFIMNKSVEEGTKYREALKNSKANNPKKFNESAFRKLYGVREGERNEQYFRRSVAEQWSTNEKIEEMQVQFSNFKQCVVFANANGIRRFYNENLATYHCYKHNTFESKDLSPEEYFEIAKALFENNQQRIFTFMSQDGKCFCDVYHDANNGAFGVLDRIIYDTPPKQFIATVFYQRKLNDHQVDRTYFSEIGRV